MKEPVLNFLLPAVLVGLLFALSHPAYSQAQALNGQVEGTVTDQGNASVSNAVVTAANIETGATRTVITNQGGFYRMPLLPRGTYRISAAARGFKLLVRDGITLSTGQSATIDLQLEPGEIRETVSVSGDAPVADSGKTDIGRTVDSSYVKNLPLTSRNPYNFAFLQANVSGGLRADLGIPRINANGFARRVNYLLDGNVGTQSDRAGVRLMTLSETFITEVQLITNNMSAEFGNTPGLVMNLITPSGTNSLTGIATYRFSRTPLYARPFFYSSSSDLPQNNTDNFAVTLGGPIIKDRWHFSGSYDLLKRDDKISRIVSIQPAHRDLLISAGVPSSIFVPTIPVSDRTDFYFFRTDVQLKQTEPADCQVQPLRRDS